MIYVTDNQTADLKNQIRLRLLRQQKAQATAESKSTPSVISKSDYEKLINVLDEIGIHYEVVVDHDSEVHFVNLNSRYPHEFDSDGNFIS